MANRNELKGAYQQARRQQKRVQCCGLGPAARRTTLAVYVLSNYNIALAVRVACRLSTYKRPEDAGFPTAAALEELFLESPPTDWLDFGELAAQRAHAFLAEAATSDWVRDCNVLHGVAPSSMDVFLHWEHAFIGHQLDVGVPPRRYGPSTLPYSVCMHRISLKGPISGPSFRVCFVALYCCTLLDASVLFPHRMLCPARSMLFGGICAIYTRSLPTETFSC